MKMKSPSEQAAEYAERNVMPFPGDHHLAIKAEREVAASHWLAGHAAGRAEAEALCAAIDRHLSSNATRFLDIAPDQTALFVSALAQFRGEK